MSGYRPEYSRDEQQRIIDYICNKNDFYSLRGNMFWKQMSESGEFNRTWQSLKEHFRKRIFPNLHLYKMDAENYKFLKAGYQSTQAKSKPVPREEAFVYDMKDSDSDDD